jgi:hypothetical protein
MSEEQLDKLVKDEGIDGAVLALALAIRRRGDTPDGECARTYCYAVAKDILAATHGRTLVADKPQH